ncbi:MAG TPA: tyrosine-type recombinase/integrase, partial [Ktedonobacteraceae bacterium]|nr:tyrosine-type recombinase/integrase [Ktedonobacteraceae bacterium]
PEPILRLPVATVLLLRFLRRPVFPWFSASPPGSSLPRFPLTVTVVLGAMRKFFSELQKRPYIVEGKRYPKLALTWLPNEAFKTPDDVKVACQPNPRDIQEDTWFKLIWASCTLSKEKLDGTGAMHFPLAYYRAASLIWVTAARRSDEIRRLSVGCVRREWAPEMCDEQGQQIEAAEELCYLRVPTNKMKGEFYVPIPAYVADAIEVWESVRPPSQKMLEDRKTHKSTKYLFQCRNEQMGITFLNRSVIPLLCKLAGVSQTDVVGKITSHRARATTATWMRKMGMSPADIGKILGHTNPARSLPWYMREDKHHLGRAHRKANPLERYVAAILDTNAHARQEPCVFYYLADGPDGRPRMCGNPHFSRCIHQMTCRECEAFIDTEMAEVIEKREGAVIISVPIPLPPQMVEELNEQDEGPTDIATRLAALPPPELPSPAFHFNKNVPMRSPSTSEEDLHARKASLEAQIAKKQGKADRRSAALRALFQELAEVNALIQGGEKQKS